MKRRISFLLSIFMLMQVFFCLPIMAEDSGSDTPTTDLVEAVVGNSFMYADEDIYYIEVNGSFSSADEEIAKTTA